MKTLRDFLSGNVETKKEPPFSDSNFGVAEKGLEPMTSRL